MKRDSPCFRIIDLKLFNRPLSAYNTKIRLRTRIIKRIQQYLVITTQNKKKILLKRLFEKGFERD